MVAIDIGSTWVKAILGTSSGERLTEVRTHRTDAGSLLPDLEELVSVVSDGHDVDDIVVSVGGTIDKDEGTLTYLLTSDGDTLENLGIVDHLEDRFGVDVTLLNDCEAAVVGEWVFGAGEDVDTLCYLTFSSGIGAGVIDHGHLLRGEHGSSAEVGLFPIRPTSDVERHGIAGCWEAFASGEGIAEYVSLRLASEDRETVLTQTECTAEAFFEAVEGGDEVAQAYLDEVGRLSAAGLGTVVQAYNPGKITVGGSVAIHNWDVLWDAIERYRDSYVFLDVAEPRVTPLGEHVELYGCLGYESFERAG